MLKRLTCALTTAMICTAGGAVAQDTRCDSLMSALQVPMLADGNTGGAEFGCSLA